MGKSAKKSQQRMTKRMMFDALIDLFHEHSDRALTYSRIWKELRLTTHPQKMLCGDLIGDMLIDGSIVETSNGHFRLVFQKRELTGIIQRSANGRILFAPDEDDESVYIAERHSMHALHGDRVRVSLFARRRGRNMPEGEVVEIIERANDTFVGILKVERNYAFLLTESRTLDNDIFIPRDKLKGGKSGDKAVVKIVEWPEDARNPIGHVVDILGKAGNNDTEMHAILAEFGLPYKYPIAVEQAANHISDTIPADEIARRLDMRDVLTCTIDPHDAKDFDDALSIRPIGKNLWEVGVHIADVTHYVGEGGIIDKEAQHRATSVYLVDRTIPMLPERLCNNICSLRPNEDKLTYSVIFHIDDKGRVKYSQIAHTVIHSDRRYTYEEVQEIIEGRPSPNPSLYGGASQASFQKNPSTPKALPIEEEQSKGLRGSEGVLEEALLVLNSMAQQMRAARFAGGAINFDRVEVRFDIDEKGHPVSVHLKESKEAHQLIEEFMLLANRTVAETIGKVPVKKAKVFPYRIHDVPDAEKLDNLARLALPFGHKVRTTGDKVDIAKSFNKLLADVKGKREQHLIETVSLRAMQKARYSTDNIGHYGLAMDYYTHFTSPIRRYPDMMVHRLLSRYLEGGRSASKSKYEELCDHSSSMEQLAASAERASIKYKQVEYMADRMGIAYDAIISGVTEWGLYAEIIENKCEGLIPMRDLDDDYYEFDERNYCLVGRRTHKRYALGDTIKIQVARCNLEKKQLDFALVE
ncbi:MAG: RNB domain-containing ribonuclease [Bacteroidaceae bacterium]|nr:RNB domain-containing ribonuclease [Bacteroidaceae bacterium]